MCTKCGKKEASVYYKQNINGKVTEMNLCEDCAAELRKKTDAEFGSFWKGFGEMNLLAPFFGLRPSSRLGSGRTCPVCGATYRDFAEVTIRLFAVSVEISSRSGWPSIGPAIMRICSTK